MAVQLALTSDQCSSQAIDLYLSNQLALSDRSALERHLDRCDSCQKLMQQQAAEEDFWKNLQINLNADDALPPSDFSGNIENVLKTAQKCIDDSTSLECSNRRYNASDSSTSLLAAESLLLHHLEPSNPAECKSLGRIGQFEAIEVIGRGGMGLVIKALDIQLNRIVAIKTILPQLNTSQTSIDRLTREARAAASLRHENIIPIYGIESWNNYPLIVMPYIAGGTLQSYAERRDLSLRDVILIGIQVCTALYVAHQQGIIHRDVKPSNILMQDGVQHVLLTDFGLARADGDQSLTMTGDVAGLLNSCHPNKPKVKTWIGVRTYLAWVPCSIG